MHDKVDKQTRAAKACMVHVSGETAHATVWFNIPHTGKQTYIFPTVHCCWAG